MPVARCNVRLYRNMLAIDLLHLVVALVVLQQVEQNYKLLKSKAFHPAERTAALLRVHGSLYTKSPTATPPFWYLLGRRGKRLSQGVPAAERQLSSLLPGG